MFRTAVRRFATTTTTASRAATTAAAAMEVEGVNAYGKKVSRAQGVVDGFTGGTYLRSRTFSFRSIHFRPPTSHLLGRRRTE